MVWRHFPLHPEIPEREGGITLEELFGPRLALFQPMLERLRVAMEEEGLPYRELDRTYNTRRAQELGAWADGEQGVSLHDALFRAYFVDGRDIGDVEVLVSVAEDCGLEAEAARRALAERSHQQQVDDDWMKSRELAITGVPTFLVGQPGLEGRRAVVGAQPYETLARLLESCEVPRREPADAG